MKTDIIKKYTNGEVTVVWQPDKCIHYSPYCDGTHAKIGFRDE